MSVSPRTAISMCPPMRPTAVSLGSSQARAQEVVKHCRLKFFRSCAGSTDRGFASFRWVKRNGCRMRCRRISVSSRVERDIRGCGWVSCWHSPVSFGDGQIHVRHSKGGKERTVPMSQEGIEFFDQITAGKAGDTMLFQQDSGEPRQRIHASRYMARGCKAAKISPPAIFHDLRRQLRQPATQSRRRGGGIQELLGHADLRMTRRVYAHWMQRTIAPGMCSVD